jgi:hypothetical protein
MSVAKRIVKRILDVETGIEYDAQAAAGRALAHLVKGDPKDNWVWFKIQREFPERFRVRNPAGVWVRLDDPTAPVGTLYGREDGSIRESPAGMRVTTLEIDDGKLAAVRAILGTRTLRETVERCFDDVITRDARARSITQLERMEGLDLDKPAVMEKAWRR